MYGERIVGNVTDRTELGTEIRVIYQQARQRATSERQMHSMQEKLALAFPLRSVDGSEVGYARARLNSSKPAKKRSMSLGNK